MSAAKVLGIGVVGIGFMGRTHVQAWLAAEAAGLPARLVAVGDPSAERRAGRVPALGNVGSTGATESLFDPDRVRGHATVEEMLDDEEVEVVSLCTPTPSHVEIGVRILESGRHLLVEKPVALESSEVRRLAAAAQRAGRLCMPAMCMRFWPGWDWLKERVEGGDLGAVRSATFQRLGSMPSWSESFYADLERSGGALVDLHVHDADFVRHLFGDPDRVVATGDLLHVTTLYRYAEGPAHVVAEGAWDHHAGFPFRMRYVVNFERATADFELGRDPELLVHRDGSSAAVALPEGSGYERQVRHFLEVLTGARDELGVTLEDAAAVADLLAAERSALRL